MFNETERDEILSIVREKKTRKQIDKFYKDIKEQYSGVPFPDKSPKELWNTELEPIYKAAEEDQQISKALQLLLGKCGKNKIVVVNKDKTKNQFVISQVFTNLQDYEDHNNCDFESFTIYTPEKYTNEVIINL